MIDEPRVIMQDLPTTIRAFCYHDDEDNEFVVLNARLGYEMNRRSYMHELQHILHGEMYDASYKEYDDPA